MADMPNDVRLKLWSAFLRRRAAQRRHRARGGLAVQVSDRAKNPPRETSGLPVPAHSTRPTLVRRRSGHTAAALLLSVLAACSSPETSREVDSVADTQGLTTIPAEAATTTPAEDAATDPGPDLEDEEPTLLSAFYGLDDALPPISAALCDGAPGMDGLVVVVNDRLTTVTGDQFEVVTRSGARLTPMCATLAPADEPEERRTVLLIGDLGNAATDPPVEVITPRSLDTDIARSASVVQLLYEHHADRQLRGPLGCSQFFHRLMTRTVDPVHPSDPSSLSARPIGTNVVANPASWSLDFRPRTAVKEALHSRHLSNG